jgi:hypothetical protein
VQEVHGPPFKGYSPKVKLPIWEAEGGHACKNQHTYREVEVT